MNEMDEMNDEENEKIVVIPFFVPITLLSEMEKISRKENMTTPVWISKLINDKIKSYNGTREK